MVRDCKGPFVEKCFIGHCWDIFSSLNWTNVRWERLDRTAGLRKDINSKHDPQKIDFQDALKGHMIQWTETETDCWIFYRSISKSAFPSPEGRAQSRQMLQLEGRIQHTHTQSTCPDYMFCPDWLENVLYIYIHIQPFLVANNTFWIFWFVCSTDVHVFILCGLLPYRQWCVCARIKAIKTIQNK